jgi:hypothetical protein
MLNGFASSEPVISRAVIEQVAETFDVLPRLSQTEEREAPARIFPAAGRAELWSLGNAGNGDGHVKSDPSPFAEPESGEFVRVSPAPDADIVFTERSYDDSPASLDELGAAFRHSDFRRGNNGQSL